tara:strand:+ start:6915 stop:7100 length:186 start_codon:yes stop_codon:yes gene_type:complete
VKNIAVFNKNVIDVLDKKSGQKSVKKNLYRFLPEKKLEVVGGFEKFYGNKKKQHFNKIPYI